MKRNRSGRPREATTLADALSPLMRDRLHRLRDTLEKRAREAVANQLAEARPPWRRNPVPTTKPKSPKASSVPGAAPQSPVHTALQQRDKQNKILRPKPKMSRMREISPKPRKPPFEYWDFPSEAAVREPAPEFISDPDRSRLEELLRAGTDSSTLGGDELSVILGLDFGTSSTKMIVRLPYEAGEPAIAIPAPDHCRSGNDPYLWQTVLWLQGDGAFCPWPEPGAIVLNSLKQGLIQGRSNTPISESAATVVVNRAQAGVAYLAFVIRYVKGWLLVNRPNLFRGRKPTWFVNIGMPAASYDDRKLSEPFRRIGAAALQVATIESPITVEVARLFLNDPHVIEAGASEEAAERMGIAVLPETAAEMTGFAKSTRNASGLYLLVDVGAMTLDTCMFLLNQNPNKNELYAFMRAQVRPLGVDSFHWFRAEGKTELEFVQQCNRTLRTVVWDTKQHRDPNAANWKRGNDVPVFFAGGGARNHLHLDIVESLGPWLREHVRNDGVRLLELPVPRAIQCPEPLLDFGRMAVAWGLSYPPTDIGRILPMRDIEDIPSLAVADTDKNFISKDHV